MTPKEAWKIADDNLYDPQNGPLHEAILLLDKHFNEMPTIVVLCGSCKFKEHFIRQNFLETMKGNIVLSIGFFSHKEQETFEPTPEEKQMLDRLYFRKIDLAHEAVILNVGGYVGQSTRNEVNYAKSQNKVIRWLEPDRIPEDLR